MKVGKKQNKKAPGRERVSSKKKSVKKAVLRRSGGGKVSTKKSPSSVKKQTRQKQEKGKVAPKKQPAKKRDVSGKAKAKSAAPGRRLTVQKVQKAKKDSGKKGKMTALEIATKALRLEFASELERSFDICLAAMEQSANLMESRLASVLGQMENLFGGAKPTFHDGKLETVVSEDGHERTEYKYDKTGKAVSRTYRDNVLKFEIVHGKLGNALSGKMFDSDGNVTKEFVYGPDGRVTRK